MKERVRATFERDCPVKYSDEASEWHPQTTQHVYTHTHTHPAQPHSHTHSPTHQLNSRYELLSLME